MTDERDDSPAFEARVTTAQLKTVAEGIHAQLSDADADVEVHIKVFAPEDRRGRTARFLATLQNRFSSETVPVTTKRSPGYHPTESLSDLADYLNPDQRERIKPFADTMEVDGKRLLVVTDSSWKRYMSALDIDDPKMKPIYGKAFGTLLSHMKWQHEEQIPRWSSRCFCELQGIFTVSDDSHDQTLIGIELGQIIGADWELLEGKINRLGPALRAILVEFTLSAKKALEV